MSDLPDRGDDLDDDDMLDVFMAWQQSDLKSRDEMNLEAAAAEMREEGWTCDMHEPDAGCTTCARLHRRTAIIMLDAAFGGGR